MVFPGPIGLWQALNKPRDEDDEEECTYVLSLCLIIPGFLYSIIASLVLLYSYVKGIVVIDDPILLSSPLGLVIFPFFCWQILNSIENLQQKRRKRLEELQRNPPRITYTHMDRVVAHNDYSNIR